MFGSVWQKWLSRVSRPTRPIRGEKPARATRRLGVESLEDRVVPAISITVIAGASGAGTLDPFLVNGTLSSTALGSVDGTLSSGALAAVSPAFNLNVSAMGSITFDQQGPLTLQTPGGRTASFNALGGAVTVNASSSIATAGGNLTLAGSDGLVLLGPIGTAGGGFTGNADTNANTVGTFTLGAGSVISTGGGSATITAADVAIDTTTAAINAGGAAVAIQNSVGGLGIDLGFNTAGKIGLTNAELGRISATTLRVGSPTAGAITVSAGIAPPVSTLSLINGAYPVTESPGGSIAVSSLRVSSGGAVSLNNTNTVATVAGVGGAGFSLNAGTGNLTVGTVDGVSGISTTNGDIALTADGLDVQKALSAGAKVVSLQPASSGQVIDLGGVGGPGFFGISDAELALIGAGTVRVGSAASLGGITISNPIVRRAGFNTLALVTGQSGVAVTQTAPISVAKLVVRSDGDVLLTDPSNDVDAFAAQTTGGGNNVSYRDLNGVAISTVDGTAGINTNGGIVTLQAGAATQTAGANISAAALALLGSGPYTLTNAGNDVGSLAAGITGALSYTDANSLSLSPVGTTTSITTTNSAIAIKTIAGDITVAEPVNAGSADITITAGGLDSTLAITTGLVQNSGVRTIDLQADRMSLQAATSVNSTGGTVILEPTSPNRPVEIANAGTDPIGVLQLGTNELNSVMAITLRVGNAATGGDLDVNAAILPSNWSKLSLASAGKVGQAVGQIISVANLAVRGKTVVLDQANVVANLAISATGASPTAVVFADSSALTIGPAIDGLTGVVAPSGGVDLYASLGTADTTLTVSGPITAGGTGANSGLSLQFDHMAIGAAITSGGGVRLNPTTPTEVINLGGADVSGVGGVLGLTDTELDKITAAGVVAIGSITTPQTGGIVVSAPINQTGSGYNFLSLNTTGDIVGGATNAVAVTNLALRASKGITLTTNATNLDFANKDFITPGNLATGVVAINNLGGVTLTDLDGIGDATNTGGTTTFSTKSGPITIAVNLVSAAALTVTAGDSGGVGDNLTINAGKQISSPNASDIILRAGDDVVMQAGSSVVTTGFVTIEAGFNDSGDGLGSLKLLGTIAPGAGTTLTLTAKQDVTLGGPEISVTGGAAKVDVTATNGAIIDGNDPPTGSNNITAATVNLVAARGIGSGVAVDSAIEVTTGALYAKNAISGDVQVTNLAGNVVVSGTNKGAGAFSFTALGNGSVLTVLGGGSTGDIVTAGGPINLIADDMVIPFAGAPAKVDAGGGIVTLAPVTATRPIDLGTILQGTTLGLSDSELDRVFAGTVRIGNAANTGGIAVTDVITATTYPVLALRTGNAIGQLPGAKVTGLTGLALQSVNGVAFNVVGNVVTNVAATATAKGAPVTYFNTGNVAIATVDGLSGVSANAAPIDVETFAGSLTVTDTPLANDVNSNGGDIALVARGTNLNVSAGAGISSGGGNITLQANDMDLVSSKGGITAGVGRITVLPAAAGTTINLGIVASGFGSLGLSAAELDTMLAGAIQVGDKFSGTITVSAPVAPAGTSVLDLETGGGIVETGTGTVTIANLAIRSANAVNLTPNLGDIGTLAAVVNSSGQSFQLTDAGGLNIGKVDGLTGVTTKDAPISIATAGNFNVNANVDAGLGSVALSVTAADKMLTNNANILAAGGNPVTLVADRMALGAGTVTAAGGGTVTLAPFTAAQAIDIGSTLDTAKTTLELSNAELGTINTTGTLRVGSGTAGAINVSSPISVGASAFALINNAKITETGSITAAALRVTSAGPVTLNGANSVGTLAANVTGANSAFEFNNAGFLQIGNVDTVSGVTTANGKLTVTTSAGDLLVNNNITAGTGAVVLTAGGTNSTLTINPFQIGGGSAVFTADNMSINGNIDVGNGAANVATLLPFTANRPINVGPGQVPGSLNVSDAELDLFRAGIVRVGNTTVAGPITISGAITQGAGYNTLSLGSAGLIAEDANGILSVTNVAARGLGGVDLTANANRVTLLAGGTTATPFSFTNADDLFVGTVDAVVGIATTGGAVTISLPAIGKTLTVQSPIVAGNAAVNLTADDMNITGTGGVSAGTQPVTLQTSSSPRNISLGTNVIGTLGLTDGELDKVTAGVLRIGSAANAGNINLTGPLTQLNSGYTTLSLTTGGAIADLTALEQSDITVTNLALSAKTGIGSGNDLNVAVANLGAANATAGSVQVSNTGALTIPTAGVDGVVGVATTGGNVALAANGGSVSIAAGILAASGGGVSVTTTGANAGITVTTAGAVAATGGNGGVTLDASAATSGGAVTINNGPAAIDVSADGIGPITIRANDGVTVGANAVVQSGTDVLGGGTITILANANDVGGTADVTLGAGAKILTRGDIVISADPDLNGAGGTITSGAGVVLGAPGNGAANTVTLTAATDLVLPSVRAVLDATARSTAGSLRDDGDDTTYVQAQNITLTAAKAIGGDTVIAAGDVTAGTTAAYLAAIDYDLLGGKLTVTETGAGGNLQLRRVNGGLVTSDFAGVTPAGVGRQFALIAAGGPLTVDQPISLGAGGVTNLLLGGEGSPVNVNAAITNLGVGAPVTLAARNAAVSVGAAVTAVGSLNATSASNTAGDGVFVYDNLTATGAGSTITIDAGRDIVIGSAAVDIATTSATGGAITVTAARNLPGFATTGNGGVNMTAGSAISTALNNSAITVNAGQAANAGDDIALSELDAGTGPVNVQTFRGSILDANGAGVPNVSGGAIALQADGVNGIDLDVKTFTPLTAGLTAKTSNDPIVIRGDLGTQLQIASVNAGAGINGGNVTLTANNGSLTSRAPGDLTPDVVGNVVTLTATGTGTIGTGGTTGYFDIDGQFLTASTANQNIQIADVNGGVAINSVNAGSANVSLQSNNGAMTSTTVNGVADVTGNFVSLRGTNNGSFGTAANSPLEINASFLDATAAGTGQIHVRDTAGGLTVSKATTGTGNGAISLSTTGGTGVNLTLSGVNSGTGTTTLASTGAVQGSGLSPQVAAGALSLTAGTGIGGVSPLAVTAGTLAATTPSGPLNIASSGATTIGTVGALAGLTTGNGAITVANTAGSLIVAANVQAVGALTLSTADSLAANENVTVNNSIMIGSTIGNVVLSAGDVLNLPFGSTVQAPGGTLTLAGGANDAGDGGGVQFLGNADALAVSVTGGSGADTFVINPFSTVANVPIDGGAGVDIFNVTPNANTAFDVTGGTPNPVITPPPYALPGDRLNVDLAGVSNVGLSAAFVAGQGYTGTWTFSGPLPISFNTVETLAPTVGLSGTLTDNSTTAVPGTTVTYTLTVTNAGPSTATGTTVTLPLPSAVASATFSSTASGGATGNTASGSGALNETLTLPANGTVVYTIQAKLKPSATGTVALSATITAPPGIPSIAGAVQTVTDTDTLTPRADLTVTNTTPDTAPNPGDDVTYTVVVTNTGPSDAQQVKFTDALPGNATFTSAVQSSGPSFTLSNPSVGSTGGTFSATIGTLPAGASATFIVTVRVLTQAGNSVANTASVSSATPDPNPANAVTTTVAVKSKAVPPRIVVGTGPGGPPTVQVYDATNGVQIANFQAYEDTFRGGINVALGDVNGDKVPDVVVGTGVGGGPVIKVFDGLTGDLIRSFFAYEPEFRGGVNVAVGDFNGDGIDDIVAGTGVGGGPRVQVFDGRNLNVIANYFAYDPNFRGGVIVAAGDVNGDGTADVIAGVGQGGGPNARVFDGRTQQLLWSFFAYDSTVRSGVQVAAGDVNGDGFADIITGTGPGGGPHVKVFDGRNLTLMSSFFAFPPTTASGVSIGSVDANGDGRDDIIVGSGKGVAPRAKVLNGLSQATIEELDVSQLDNSGVFVGG